MNGSRKKEWIMIVSAISVALIIIAISVNYDYNMPESKARRCAEKNQVYMQDTGECREKTTDERFEDKCSSGITFDEANFSCEDIKAAGLQQAYLDDKIIKHGGSIYEKGTTEEVQAGKVVGDYCLDAEDTWSHIGETRCVTLLPSYLAHSGHNFFINEKEDYKNGFTIYMYGNYDWNEFVNAFKGKGTLLVCGEITTYEGHPQIKTTPSDIMTSPIESNDGVYKVYQYKCS